MGDKFAICGHICYSKLDLVDMPIDQVAIKLHLNQFYWFCSQISDRIVEIQSFLYAVKNIIFIISNFIQRESYGN